MTWSARDFTEDDLQQELESLRQGLLPGYLIALFALAWLWFGRVVFAYESWDLGINLAPVAFLCAGGMAAFLERIHHYELACWLVVLSLIASLGLVVYAHPLSLASSFGMIIVMAASALLGMRRASVVLALCWASCVLARWAVGGAALARLGALEEALLYFLAFGAAWLARRPLQTAVEWALSGWAKARNALLETRERRAEILRIVRALEEATYRIQRMNNELLVARREAEVARALKARFSATVSHELRGPLNLILGFSSMMVLSPERYGEPLPSAYLADIDAIYRNSKHLAALVDDVLDLSQIEAEKLPLAKELIDLNADVADPTLEIVRPLAERKGLVLRKEAQPNLPHILADPVRLRQVLLNLLNNALRFTERGSISVRLALADDGDALQMSVQDTGMGIAQEDIARLFQQFHKLKLTDSRSEGGTGLGLSICKHLVELHGGRIWVESTKGLGSTFIFAIPLPGMTRAESPVSTPQREVTVRLEEACLVIHEDHGVARTLGRVLDGYKVVGVSDVEQAKAMIEQIHPRAVLAAPATIASLQSWLEQQNMDVPLIGCSLPARAGAAALEGVVGYLIKPVNVDMLRAVLNRVEGSAELKVLLLDDDPDAVRLLELLLGALPRSYKFLRAHRGQQALQIMSQTAPDLAFVDLVLPDISGEEVIARMRADPRLCAVPVAIVSAQDANEQGMLLNPPICVHAKTSLAAKQAARYLQAILDTFRPDYLSGPAGA